MARKVIDDADRVTLYIALTDRRALEEIAARQGASLNFVIRSILKEHLSQLSQVTKEDS